MEAEIVDARVVAHESNLEQYGIATVAQCTRAYLGILGEAQQGREAKRNQFLRELAHLQLEVTKLEQFARASEQEIGYYEQLEGDIGRRIEATQVEIQALRERLSKARTERQRKEDCEALARRVNEIEPRDESQADIRRVEGELEALKAEEAQVHEQFALRKKQFQLLLHSIAELSNELGSAM